MEGVAWQEEGDLAWLSILFSYMFLIRHSQSLKHHFHVLFFRFLLFSSSSPIHSESVSCYLCTHYLVTVIKAPVKSQIQRPYEFFLYLTSNSIYNSLLLESFLFPWPDTLYPFGLSQGCTPSILPHWGELPGAAQASWHIHTVVSSWDLLHADPLRLDTHQFNFLTLQVGKSLLLI